MTSPRGFTLIELLIALGVFGILVALLLPAVIKARAAADRISCANNVRQLSLALHLYHDSQGHLPAATRTSVGDSMPFATWRVRLLPYLEQESLWAGTVRAYQQDPNPFLAKSHSAREQALRAFACPSDGRLLTAWEITSLTGTRVRTALSSYLGISGTDSVRKDGLLFLDSSTRIDNIPDGSSQTLLLGERPPSPDLVYGWWYAASGQRLTGSVDTHMGVNERNRLGPRYRGCASGPYSFRQSDVNNYCGTFHYWSLHTGGSHFSFADGSARFLRYEAEPLLSAYATRAGGEIAGPE
jgi:prepilin-type N-terminal cleavage/methylation domain-containing protein/prepilin-type processing-associated H-X9-DG protein